MSERAAMVGNGGEPFSIEHKGRTYTIRRVVTEGVMDAVEMKLYEKARTALYAQKDMMSETMYERKLDELRGQFQAGEFAFEHATTAAFLKTKPGVMLLLQCMMNESAADILVLMAERPADMKSLLSDVLELSFPKRVDLPKRLSRQPKKGRRRR